MERSPAAGKAQHRESLAVLRSLKNSVLDQMRVNMLGCEGRE